MFETERFNESVHYEMLLDWWHKQKWPHVSLEILPPVGLLVKHKETGDYLYGMFLYHASQTPITWLEFIVGNPDVAPKYKRGALDAGIEAIADLGKQEYGNIGMLFTTTNNPGLRNALVKCDFTVGDLNMVQLVKNV